MAAQPGPTVEAQAGICRSAVRSGSVVMLVMVAYGTDNRAWQPGQRRAARVLALKARAGWLRLRHSVLFGH